MTEEQLGLLDFVRSSERGEWKLVKHAFNNVHAVRSCGRLERFAGDDDAAAFVRARAVEAMLKSFHRLAAGDPA